MALVIRQRREAPTGGTNRRGLLAPGGAILVEPGDERWVGGVEWEGGPCGSLLPRPVVCEDTSKPEDVDPQGIRTADAFYVSGYDQCSTLDTGRDRAANARANLAATESYQAELEFWDGVASRAAAPDLENMWLARFEAATAAAAGPLGYVRALAALDQALAACLHGQQGMIHATPFTASMWMAAGLLRVEGQRLLTVMDSIVVAGSGYSGSAPAVADGGAPVAPADLAAGANAYGTGLVYAQLGAVAVLEDTDRSVNTSRARAERPVLLSTAGCCVLTVEVDHTSEIGA